MKLFRSGISLSVFALMAACDNSVAPTIGHLPGIWIAPAEAASPNGRYERTLTFRGDGSFTSEFRSYGIYAFAGDDDLSSYSRTEGTYAVEIEGNGLEFRPVRITSWDRFYGDDSPETVRNAHPDERLFDDAHYEILAGQVLKLDFTVYPADAAEPAQLVFLRAD
jgi:hypothetical protein